MNERPWRLNALLTVSVGILGFVALDALLYFLFNRIPTVRYFPEPYRTILFFGTSGILVAGAIYLNVEKVPIAYLGVPTLFGQRINSLVITEGWAWVLPIVMDIVPVSAKEETLTIDKHLLMTLGEDTMGIEMESDLSLQWRIAAPSRTLSISREALLQSMEKLAVDSYRKIATKISDFELMKDTDSVAEKMKADLFPPFNRWGIEILSINVPTVIPASAKLRDMSSQKRIEQMQQAGQLVEGETLTTAAERMASALGVSGEKALEAIQSEHGTVKTNVIKINSTEGELAKAAAILAYGGKKQEPPKRERR